MKNVLILHGAGNDSSGNWFPWLKTELEKKGYKVWSPNLPNSDNPVQAEWLDTILKSEFEFNDQTIMIGHSSGGTLILRILERLPKDTKINKAILVATPLDKGKLPEFFPLKESLTLDPFNFKKIKTSCKIFCYISSDNDPYDCGKRHGEVMKKELGGELKVFPGQAHFNLEKSPEYKRFPLLLELV
jgi:predicted alpha/beta hydrolase family esterase